MENQCLGEASRANAAADAIDEASSAFSVLANGERQPPRKRVDGGYGAREQAAPCGQRCERQQQEHDAGKLHVGRKPADRTMCLRHLG